MIDVETIRSSLARVPGGRALAAVLEAALQAVDPERCTAAALELDGETVRVPARGWSFSVPRPGRLLVLAMGKAAHAMARGVRARLEPRIDAMLVVTKHATTASVDDRTRVILAGHPVPDARSVQAGRAIQSLLATTTARDLVLCLISGGASSLCTAPVEPLSLADLRATTDALLRGGAPIDALNTVRKHLDALKGGGLARAAAPATVVSLVLSDVVGDPLDVIASGPTCADPSTFEDALAVLDRYREVGPFPRAVVEVLVAGARGERRDTPKPGDPVFERVHDLVVAGNDTAVAQACRAAQAEGFDVEPTVALVGEARAMGEALARQMRTLAARGGRRIVVAGGETTVRVRGSGHGGRNLEVALGAVAGLADLDGATLLTFATDGEDGPTDAAGAVVTGTTLRRARTRGLDPAAHLDRNDAYAFFDGLGDLVRTGPTGINVCDLALCCTWPS